MVGFMAQESRELVRYTSIVRGVEAAGGAIACKLTASTTTLLSTYHVFLAGISSTKAPVSSQFIFM